MSVILIWIFVAGATNPGVVVRVNNKALEYGKLMIVWRIIRTTARLQILGSSSLKYKLNIIGRYVGLREVCG